MRPPRLPRESLLWACAVLLLLLLAWIVLAPQARRALRPSGAPAVAAAPPPAEPASLLVDPDGAGDGAGDATPWQAPSAVGDDAGRIRELARYPGWSRAIHDGVDPVLRGRQVTPGLGLGPEGEEPRLLVAPTQRSFEAPGAVWIHAWLERDGFPAAAQAVRAEVHSEDGTPVASLRFSDDGEGADELADDQRYVARLDPDELGGLARGIYRVDADAITAEGELRNASTSFAYSVPSAQLTGLYLDSVVRGNLLLEAQVRVHVAGHFELQATLGALDGVPIAWARSAGALEPGLAFFPLTFYGLALREAGRNGPYRLLSVAITHTDATPTEQGDVVRDAFLTAAYRVTDFHDVPFQDPALLEAARRLEGATGLGVRAP